MKIKKLVYMGCLKFIKSYSDIVLKKDKKLKQEISN